MQEPNKGESMAEPNARKHPRCYSTTAVTISFLNRSGKYDGIATNYSQSGMYIESRKALNPGTLIQIRPFDCQAPDTSSRSLNPYYCAGSVPETPECRQLKTLVLGEVKRCEELGSAENPRYGLAVRYVSPAV